MSEPARIHEVAGGPAVDLEKTLIITDVQTSLKDEEFTCVFGVVMDRGMTSQIVLKSDLKEADPTKIRLENMRAELIAAWRAWHGPRIHLADSDD